MYDRVVGVAYPEKYQKTREAVENSNEVKNVLKKYSVQTVLVNVMKLREESYY